MSEDNPTAAPQFLAHKQGDHVAVAVQDLSPGRAHGCVLDGNHDMTVEVKDSVPLGHKIALVGLDEGADVIEYGVRVGITSAPIAAGQYVHTHNVRSARWQTSVAN